MSYEDHLSEGSCFFLNICWVFPSMGIIRSEYRYFYGSQYVFWYFIKAKRKIEREINKTFGVTLYIKQSML